MVQRQIKCDYCEKPFMASFGDDDDLSGPPWETCFHCGGVLCYQCLNHVECKMCDEPEYRRKAKLELPHHLSDGNEIQPA